MQPVFVRWTWWLKPSSSFSLSSSSPQCRSLSFLFFGPSLVSLFIYFRRHSLHEHVKSQLARTFSEMFFNLSEGPSLNHGWPGMGVFWSPWPLMGPWERHDDGWTALECQYRYAFFCNSIKKYIGFFYTISARRTAFHWKIAVVNHFSQKKFYDKGASVVLRRLTAVSADLPTSLENNSESQKKFEPGIAWIRHRQPSYVGTNASWEKIGKKPTETFDITLAYTDVFRNFTQMVQTFYWSQ